LPKTGAVRGGPIADETMQNTPLPGRPGRAIARHPWRVVFTGGSLQFFETHFRPFAFESYDFAGRSSLIQHELSSIRHCQKRP
jgi:hypothetical protein